MIVTRSWLSEFVDLSDIDDDTLYETFNRIGLEVDRIEKIAIEPNVVVGEIKSCKKHPDADKLNVCEVDIGGDIRQIVCGAANVKEARYVAVATAGAVLPNGMEIKHAKLRGVESEGMICSSSELGLPRIEKGIWVLDDSLGKMVPGKALAQYPLINDTIIELELTANRGDCLSIYGVARDLAVGLGKELKGFEYKLKEGLKLGIGREAQLHVEGEVEANLRYKLATIAQMGTSALIRFRSALTGMESDEGLEEILSYATHTTGVILRAYATEPFVKNGKIGIDVREKSKGIVEILGAANTPVSVVGAYQDEKSKAQNLKKVIFEASYINPDILIEAVATHKLRTDALYYKSSRGSSPDLHFGLCYLTYLLDDLAEVEWYEGVLEVKHDIEPKKLPIDIETLSQIIGMKLEASKVVNILRRLGFDIKRKSESILVVSIPFFRHDIANIQDIAEEVMRIVGIDNIPLKPLHFTEKLRLTPAFERYRMLRGIKRRAVGNGFFEHLSYTFTKRELLSRYGFETLHKRYDIANPIAEELNTLRTTLLINLLLAAKRNRNHFQRRIPLFEIGVVYDKERNEHEKVAFVFCGDSEYEGVANSGKPTPIDFNTFVEKLSATLGPVKLTRCKPENALMHPYQSAAVEKNGKVCGFISKLHPSAQKAWELETCYIAEFDLGPLLPEHVDTTPVSKFQGTYKDLSIMIDQDIDYEKVRDVIEQASLPLLKRFYPIDVYTDEELGDQKSLTVRFFLRSDVKTLDEKQIEETMATILQKLEKAFSAKLR